MEILHLPVRICCLVVMYCVATKMQYGIAMKDDP